MKKKKKIKSVILLFIIFFALSICFELVRGSRVSEKGSNDNNLMNFHFVPKEVGTLEFLLKYDQNNLVNGVVNNEVQLLETANEEDDVKNKLYMENQVLSPDKEYLVFFEVKSRTEDNIFGQIMVLNRRTMKNVFQKNDQYFTTFTWKGDASKIIYSQKGELIEQNIKTGVERKLIKYKDGYSHWNPVAKGFYSKITGDNASGSLMLTYLPDWFISQESEVYRLILN